MQRETWQMGENTGEEESRGRAAGEGGEMERATVQEAQGHSRLRRHTKKMSEREKHGRNMWIS